MRMLGRIFLLLLVLCLGAAGWQWWGYSHRQLVAPNAEVVFDVPRGHAGTRLAEVLQQAGVDVPSWKMALALRLRGAAARIKAGNYLITGPATLQGLLDELVSGQQEKGKLITLVEGWNMRDLRAALKKAPDLNDTLSGLSDAALMEKLGMPGVSPEGRFAPDTYAYRPGSDDVALLRRALALQQRRLDAVWENRAADSPLKTPADLLTLASVVEKETGHVLDREMVASVFTNRLRKGMPLQSDPTTIYGLGERFDGATLLPTTPMSTGGCRLRRSRCRGFMRCRPRRVRHHRTSCISLLVAMVAPSSRPTWPATTGPLTASSVVPAESR